MLNQRSQAGNDFGGGGTFNYNGNDGTIARFGWKAQNKSLELFAGEAYDVEMGITNEIFPQERPLPGEEQGLGLPADCLNLAGKGYPEDATNFAPTVTGSAPFAVNASISSDTVAFAIFMRLLAPPTPSATTPGARGWRTMSRRAPRAGISSARRPCGAWVSGSSSCMTAAAAIWCRRSRLTPATARRRTRWFRATGICRRRASRTC